MSKEVNFLTGFDFIVTIHQEVWDQLNINDRKALLDHELQHCSAGSDDAGNKVWYVQGHDLEDFHAIIRRHGLWSAALKKLENMLIQTELQFEQPKQKDTLQEISGRPDLKVIKSNQPSMLLPQGKEEESNSDDDKETAADDENIIDVDIVTDDDEQEGNLPKHGNTGTEG